MNKPVLISGIQPTGSLHLGNYLGALKNFVELQNSGKYDCYFFIADYHSLTEHYSQEEKKKQILDLAASFLASGLDPQRSTLFIQSSVPASTELAWILSTITPLGELQRMTQFKDKSSAFGRKSINTGLFTYPVLMAADILLYDAKIVPVGEDQLQHLELTRALARKFNSRFGKIFTEPKAVLTNVPRLMSLKNPLKKMSKSDSQGCLFLDDNPVLIRKKIMQAVTDSFNTIAYDPERRPGISNLITMYSAMSELDKNAVVKKFTGLGYAPFKQELAELLIEKLAPFREAKAKLLLRSKETLAAFSDGSKKANKAAEQKMKKIRNVLGLLSS